MRRLAGRALRFLVVAAKVLPSYLAFAVSFLVPKKKGLWLFGAWMGRKYSDNPKYVQRYVLEHEPSIEAIWIVKDKELCRRMRADGVPVAYAYSAAGLRHQLRAELVVFTHSVADEYVAPLIAPRVRRVQTWHGMPMKKIGYDDNTQQYSKGRTVVRSLMFPCDMDRCDLVIAGSEADANKYRTAFNVKPSDVRITGYPRNDELIRSVARAPADVPRRRAIYMPTFRGAPGSEFELFRTSKFDFGKADAVLQRIGWHLYVKLHPLQVFAPSDLRALENAKCMDPLPSGKDLYGEVGVYDVLITDFSGIYFDFLITGKPIVMAPFEIESYLATDRELYYKYQDICPDAPCSTWDEVFGRLAELSSGCSAPTARYAELQSKFHKYLDANSSRRVVAELMALTGHN